ncbi:MAG: TatD family hydrolase [Treponema sp.]|jgi:TatD DNase family protein|nr:TatD family hydrolase [Treponema sp.]
MAADAHCHLSDLLKQAPHAEQERRRLGLACAASAWNREDFTCHEELARNAQQDKAPRIFLCFALHPQLPAAAAAQNRAAMPGFSSLLNFMETLAVEERIQGIGETGFDLYNPALRNTETLQDELFKVHLELALTRQLPLILHVRKAMHKVFAYKQTLKRLSGVIFHAYSGTLGEGEALLRQGINAYFSFGTSLVWGRKETIRSCAGLPLNRVLLETDAPYQPLRGFAFSSWQDLPVVLQAVSRVRGDLGHSGEDRLASLMDANFYRAYGSPE